MYFSSQLDALVESTRDALRADLSGDGMARLGAHVEREKRNMKVPSTSAAELPDYSQRCGMSPQYSQYRSSSADGTYVYTTVTVSGTSTGGCGGCQECNGITHTGSVYNLLGSTGGWTYGTPTSPFIYLSTSSSKTVAAAPGTLTPWSYASQVWCSGLGRYIFSMSTISTSVAQYTTIQHNYPSNPLPNPPNPCFIRRFFDAVNPDGSLHAAEDVLFSDGKGNGVNPPAGSKVTAMESGRVVKSVGTNGPAPEGYPACTQTGGHHAGNYVKIQASDNYTTIYFHVKPNSNIVDGATVNAGDQIGVLDTSGCQKAPHLHVQRKDPYGHPVNFTLPCVNPTPQQDFGEMYDYVPSDL